MIQGHIKISRKSLHLLDHILFQSSQLTLFILVSLVYVTNSCSNFANNIFVTYESIEHSRGFSNPQIQPEGMALSSHTPTDLYQELR